MRALFISFCTLIIGFSCGSKKQVPVTIGEQQDANQPMVEGIVHIGTKEEDCTLYIQLTDGSCVYPVNLDETLHKEGTRVKFSFTPSRAMLPQGCESCRAVVIDQIR
jgi:hypothetical protein